ncbi:MAG: AmmeMemoRadiSam system protein B [Methanobacteriota archaeon]
MRFPAVAGAFYEGSKDRLLRQIEACFTHRLGPGRAPRPGAGPRRLVGLVVPHAGYVYSGPIAAHSYAALADDGLRASYVVLGPNHHGAGAPLAIAQSDWQTPLGVVPVDPELFRALATPPLEDDPSAHRHEHSIEVQLPFLQVLSERSTFVPVCMAFQEYELAQEVGEVVASAASYRDVLVIASSDFTHVGPQYYQMPPRGTTAPEYARKQDAKAIERILALDAKGFADRVRKDDISMCGHGPVAALLVAAKALGGKDAKLLKYGTSSDVSGDDTTAVGYAAIAIYR